MNDKWQHYLFEKPSATWYESNGTLCDTIARNLHQPWDFWKLSHESSLTWNFIDDHIHHGWDWYALSERDDLDFEVVHRHSEKNWNWRKISEHANVTFDTIRKYPNHFWTFTTRKVPIDILTLCPSYQQNFYRASSTAPLETIVEHFELYWNWNVISNRKDLTMHFVEDHINLPWDWHVIEKRNDFLIEVVQKYPDKEWNWTSLSRNRNLTWDIINQTMDKPWDYKYLSSRCDVPLEIVMKCPEKWNIQKLVSNNGHWKLVLDFPHVKWNFKQLCRMIPWEYVQKEADTVAWDWNVLSCRDDIPLRFLATHVHLPWSWQRVSINKTITETFIMYHYWFPWVKPIIRKRFGYLLEVLQIQRWWLKLYYNPSSHVCIQRLLRDCAALNELSKQIAKTPFHL